MDSIKSGTALSVPKSSIEKLKEQNPSSLEAEKTRLKEATKAFESFFMYQLMKSMRKTVPESGFAEGSPFSGGMGKDMFTDMFDMELSNKMVNGSSNSISEIMYRSLEPIIESKYKGVEGPVEIKPLPQKEIKPIEIDRDKFKTVPEKPGEFKKVPVKDDFMPVQPRLSSVKEDKILSKFGAYIEKAAEKHSLDPGLIISVIKQESNGDPDAVSQAGAKGLMQLVDSTASDMGVREVFDPEQNIDGGARYLKQMLDKFGSVKLALAAYNAGPGNVMRYNGIPPFEETRNYVEKVIDSLNTINGRGEMTIAKVNIQKTDNYE